MTLHGTIINNGGAPIIERAFWIRRENDSSFQTRPVFTTSNPFTLTITNLSPNTTYVVRAVARNSSGHQGHGQSGQMIFTTPTIINAPGVPQNFRATPGNRQVTLNWSAPASNGGGAITRYEVSVNNGSWITAHSSTGHTFTGLTNGVWHNFRVRAVNSVGAGNPASVSATPAALPSLTGSSGAITSTTVTLTGTITDTGGFPITARGFWIRAAGSSEIEHLVNTSSNSFSQIITGLQPGTRYYARAIARNNSGLPGTGQSAQIVFTTQSIAVPSAPLNFRATPGNRQVTLNWSAPTNNGGAPITGYQVSRDGGLSWVAAQSSTAHTFTGLANGTAHTFRVRAVNSAGAGTQASVTVTPAALPSLTGSSGAITSTTVTLTGTITDTGGFPITARGFWIRAAGSSEIEHLVNTSSNSFSQIITGLQPGTRYYARAIARNNSGLPGTGQSAQIIFTTQSIAVPSAPLNFRATPGNTQVTLNWSAPTNNGGAPITGYQVSRDGGLSWVAAQSSTAHTFTGLANGTAHTFRVRAINSAGAGTQASVTVAPAALPSLTGSSGAVTTTSVTLIGTITDTGGFPITARGFWIRAAGSSEIEHLVNTSSNSFSQIITGLQPGTRYYARAIARNSSGLPGTGQSAQIIFTTQSIAVPSAPLNFRATPGNTQVTLNWSAPASNGGTPITGYQVSRDGGLSWVSAQSSTAHTFTGLTNGTSHNFRVRAVNSAGVGAQATVTAIPATLPSLTIAMEGAPTSNSVTLRGNITDIGGFQIIERGFWIRPYNGTQERAVLVNTTSNPFTAEIHDLIPNTRYVARAVARNSSGLPGHGQSGQLIFTTPAVPGNATVTFNPNGGSVNPTTRVVQVGAQLGSYPTPTRAGEHTFAGWWTHINNNVTSGTRISPLITIQNNVTYHARWNSTVTFNPAGGNLSVTDRTRTVQSNTAVGALPTPTREGHFFVGWFPPTGNTRVEAGDIVDGNITYTARWVNNAPNSFTITYRDPHVSGVTGQLPPQQTVTIGRAVNLANNLNNRQRQGYILAGWSTQNRLNHRDPEFTLSQRNVMFTGTGEIVLYAHWAPRHWTNVRNVNVQLHADYLFDPGVYNNRNNYLTNLRTISQNAAVPFYRTFGINMNISNDIFRVDSIKTECCQDHMTRPNFICTIHTIQAPTTFPSNWNQFFTEHHSSGDLMIHMFDAMPSTSHGLHTMFFAGVICSRRGRDGSITLHGGMAIPRGNTSINSSSAFEFYGRPGNFNSDPRVATRIVQHEWSHNYGAGDPNCLVHCIMDGGSWFTVPQDIDNLWCYRCREDIIINRTRH